jgi:hypothetical protein
MMFDELHDPEPLDVGVRQLAIVAERARAIRQRRNKVGVRTLCVGVVALGAAAAWSTVPRSTGDPLRLEPLPTAPSTSIAPSTSTAPTTSVTTAPHTATTPAVAIEPIPLLQAAMLPSLPAIEITRPVVVAVAGDDVEVYQDDSRRVCVRSSDAELGCSEPDVRLHVGDLAGRGGDGALDTDAAGPYVVIVVDDDVRLNFLTVGAVCAPGNQIDGRSTVRVWVCEGLDVARATADDRGSGVVVIATTAER